MYYVVIPAYQPDEKLIQLVRNNEKQAKLSGHRCG